MYILNIQKFSLQIFRKERYDKIRNSILSDILSSIDRLPSSKKPPPL